LKLIDLHEMAIKSGDLRKLADEFATKNVEKWKQFPHIADIDSFKVRRSENHYVLFDDDVCIAHFQVDENGPSSVIVDGVWVKLEYSGKKIFSKFLWFLKSREHYSKIVLGDVHSIETYNLLKSGGLSRFKKSWENKNSEKINFDTNSIDDFYGNSKWKLVLECSDDSFDDFPRFTEQKHWIKEAYDWQIE